MAIGMHDKRTAARQVFGYPTIGAVGNTNFAPGIANIWPMLAQPAAVSPRPCMMMTVALCSPLASKTVGSGYDSADMAVTAARPLDSERDREAGLQCFPKLSGVAGTAGGLLIELR